MLDRSIFEADIEAECAYSASLACDEAAKHLLAAERRCAAAKDPQKALSARQVYTHTCIHAGRTHTHTHTHTHMHIYTQKALSARQVYTCLYKARAKKCGESPKLAAIYMLSAR